MPTLLSVVYLISVKNHVIFSNIYVRADKHENRIHWKVRSYLCFAGNDALKLQKNYTYFWR